MKRPRILELRPLQYVLGMKEIESKISKMRDFDKKQLADYCAKHVIPVVRGPKKELYMIDHHHFARACWELDVDSYSIKVVKDLSHKTDKDFWNHMVRKNWVYLHDQFGIGPHTPHALPADIRCLADDPFRSLAWAVLETGNIKKENIPFFEFKWAAFFRLNLDTPLHSKSDFKTAIALAKKLAQTKAASGLPGFIG